MFLRLSVDISTGMASYLLKKCDLKPMPCGVNGARDKVHCVVLDLFLLLLMVEKKKKSDFGILAPKEHGL